MLYIISIYLLPTYSIIPSCAFDSLSNSVLISRLEMIGIRGTVFKWFSSYILNRSSSVKICNFSTRVIVQSSPLHYSVPQISVIDPLIFSIYIFPIHNIMVNFQMYTITFTLMILNYIPSYPIPQMYYQITHNYVNVHQLSDHGFNLTTFYLTLQNLHS